MFSIHTDLDGVRRYTVPRCLLDVARAVFPSHEEREALFSLLRKLPADRVETTIRIASNNDVERAAEYAARWI